VRLINNGNSCLTVRRLRNVRSMHKQTQCLMTVTFWFIVDALYLGPHIVEGTRQLSGIVLVKPLVRAPLL
jgi:hypothetical protein